VLRGMCWLLFVGRQARNGWIESIAHCWQVERYMVMFRYLGR
jgi:hypothetical protein